MGLILDPNTPLSLSKDKNSSDKMVFDEQAQKWVSTEEGGDVDLSGFESSHEEDKKVDEKVGGKEGEKQDEKVGGKDVVEEVDEVEEVEEIDMEEEADEDVTGSLNTSEYELVEKVIIRKPTAALGVTATPGTMPLPLPASSEGIVVGEIDGEDDVDGVDVSGSLQTDEYALVVGVKKPSMATTKPTAPLSPAVVADAPATGAEEIVGIEIEEDEMEIEDEEEKEKRAIDPLGGGEYAHSELALKSPPSPGSSPLSPTPTPISTPIPTPLEGSLGEMPSLFPTPVEVLEVS